MAAKKCSHLDQIVPGVKPSGTVCQKCLAAGQKWVQLRQCMTCGHVGCCDSTPGQHATGHFHETKHAIMRSAEPGQSWYWCYADETMVEVA